MRRRNSRNYMDSAIRMGAVSVSSSRNRWIVSSEDPLFRARLLHWRLRRLGVDTGGRGSHLDATRGIQSSRS
jgi:hypothetical protein